MAISPATPANRKILDQIEAITNKHNVCNIHHAAQSEVGPGRSSMGKQRYIKQGDMVCNGGTPCCDGCSHLSKSGCSVSAFACRMWFCSSAWDKLPFLAQIEIMVLVYKWDEKANPLMWRHDEYPIHKDCAMGYKTPKFDENRLDYHFSHPSLSR